jgi:hypothetical protein
MIPISMLDDGDALNERDNAADGLGDLIGRIENWSRNDVEGTDEGDENKAHETISGRTTAPKTDEGEWGTEATETYPASESDSSSFAKVRRDRIERIKPIATMKKRIG